MQNPKQQLMQAVQLHNAGNLEAADRLYQQVLAVDPRNPDALHLSGLVAFQRGQLKQAVTLFKRAIKRNGKVADFHNNLGEALRLQGKLPQARDAYKQALALQPAHPLGLNNLGTVLSQLGQERQAMELFNKALKAKPDYLDAHFNLGRLCYKQGQLAQAIEHFQAVERLNPAFAPVRVALGNALRAGGELEAALTCYQRALEADSRDVVALSNQGECLFRLGRLEEAEASLRQALTLNGKLAASHNTLGSIKLEQGEPAAALESFQRALELDSNLLPGHLNLGMAYREQGMLDEALACYDRALTIDPQSPEAHFSRGFTRLMRGEWASGWADYEWRFKSAYQAPLPEMASPLWDGNPAPEARMLLVAEQGFGDTLMAVRFAAKLQGRFARLLIQAPVPLVTLLKTVPGVDGVFSRDEPLPAHDLYCPLMSLPHRLNATLEDVADPVPYLSAPADRVAYWAQRLAGVDAGLRVGLCWAGSRANPKNRKRQLGLQALTGLLALPKLQWISLQKEVDAAELPVMDENKGRLHHWMDEIDDFQATAALIQGLDLVITQDSAVAHLAGALGKPVWTLVPFIHDWRWLAEGADCPWYPSMRLFRQSSPDSWQDAVDTLRGALEAWVDQQSESA